MRDGSLQSIPKSASQPRLPRIMEASVDPQPRGPDWMPITPKAGSLFHADSQLLVDVAKKGRGGGLAQPHSTDFVSGTYAWNLNAQGQPNPQPNAAELREFMITISPH